MSAVAPIRLGSSPTLPATQRRQSDSPKQDQHHDSESSLPSPSTLLCRAGRTGVKQKAAPFRSGSSLTPVPTGAIGFCSASTLMQEREHSHELATTLDLQRYMAKDVSAAEGGTEVEMKPKPTRKRAPKKDAVPKLKLDKKPQTERRPRKKKAMAVVALTVDAEQVAQQKEASPLDELQIFEYNGPGERASKLKPVKVNILETTRTLQGLDLQDEAKQDPVVLGDLQIFEYKGPEDDEPLAKIPAVKRARKPRQKKADIEDGQAQLSGAKVTKPRGRPRAAAKDEEALAHTEVAGRNAAVIVVDGTAHEVDIPHITVEVAETESIDRVLLSHALKRRRDWTPPKTIKTTEVFDLEDTGDVTEAPTMTDDVDVSCLTAPTDSTEHSLLVPAKPFLDLKGSFGYNEQSITTRRPLPVEEAAEPALKKRRVELVETTAMKKPATTKPKAAKAVKMTKEPKSPKQRRAPKETKPPKVPRVSKEKAQKAPKAPAKSSRTVTNIVLAQYQPNAEIAEGTTISSFFASTEVRAAEAAADIQAAAVKTAIKRKRSKSPVKRDSMGPPAPRSKKTTKKEVTVPSKLLSPTTALKRLEKQDILFGTSSQLAREESPTFIREIQQAVKESESQALLDETRSDLAPTRASLAILRARRGLWNDGARGEGDVSLLSPEPPLPMRQDYQELGPLAPEMPVTDAVQPPTIEIEHADTREYCPAEDAITFTLQDIGAQETRSNHDLAPLTSPAPKPVLPEHIDLVSSDAIQNVDVNTDQPRPAATKSIEIFARSDAQPIPRPNVLQDLSTNKKLNLSASYLALDNKPFPSSQRSAGTIGTRKSRTPSPTKSSRLAARATSPTSPKRRGSPVNAITISSPLIGIVALERPENTTISSPYVDVDTLTPITKTRSRIKSVSPATALLTTISSPYADIDDLPSTPNRVRAARPSKRTSSPYADVDDIEDSEPELNSSPPRRRSPAAVEKVVLELSSPLRSIVTATTISKKVGGKAKVISKSPSKNKGSVSTSKPTSQSKTSSPRPASKAKAPRTKVTKIAKPTTEEEAQAQAQLFALVTKVITTAPPTRDLKCPSWYEKILLYDPIVLEDLAGWLNRSDGLLRTMVDAGDVAASVKAGPATELEMVDVDALPVQLVAASKARIKTTAKGKGKNKKGDGSEQLVEDEDEVEAPEIIKPALLQKWCEENSVCCLWRNGLRGGVKMKY